MSRPVLGASTAAGHCSLELATPRPCLAEQPHGVQEGSSQRGRGHGNPACPPLNLATDS